MFVSHMYVPSDVSKSYFMLQASKTHLCSWDYCVILPNERRSFELETINNTTFAIATLKFEN